MSLFKFVGGFFLDIIETLVFALSIFVLIYVFFAQPHQVSGRSMFPTFSNGDYLLTNKLVYRTTDPKRGDVIIFHAPTRANCPPGGKCDFIKRIIGLPGETVSINSGHVYINNQPLNEPYIQPEYVTRGENFLKEGMQLRLGTDEYFLMGDNRPGSSDSREFGPIEKSAFIGKGWIRYWPLKTVGVIPEVTY